ncbi:MAG: hypothetical protein H8K03_06745 [Nitrospira sp.]
MTGRFTLEHISQSERETRLLELWLKQSEEFPKDEFELSDGGVAVHIADGFTSRALVLYFPNLKDIEGISEGELFRFRCIVTSFEYEYVHLESCSIVR